MNEREMHDVMTYVMADFDAIVTPEKRAVWLDQFNHVSFEQGMAAARLLISRKSFGIPKASDLHEVLSEILTGNQTLLTWGEAWEFFVTIAREYGRNHLPIIMDKLETRSPIITAALGSMAKEFFTCQENEVPMLRAQFRQRYESLIDATKRTVTKNPKHEKFAAIPLLRPSLDQPIKAKIHD